MDKNSKNIGTRENPLPREMGLYTPRVTPEDIGQLSGGQWNQLHSSDEPIKEEEE